MTFYGIGYQIPMSINMYSPLPSAIQRNSANYVYLTGTVFQNVAGDLTPLNNITVRIYGADTQVLDYIQTDMNGFFTSNIAFGAGQLVKVTINNINFQRFIDYNAYDTFYLGEFILS